MAEIISTIAALAAAYILGYGVRAERERTTHRTLKARAAMLEAANARLRDHLRMSIALNEEHLKRQFADDLAKRVAEGPLPGFDQQLRSLHVYGSSVRTLPNTPIIGGGGV